MELILKFSDIESSGNYKLSKKYKNELEYTDNGGKSFTNVGLGFRFKNTGKAHTYSLEEIGDRPNNPILEQLVSTGFDLKSPIEIRIRTNRNIDSKNPLSGIYNESGKKKPATAGPQLPTHNLVLRFTQEVPKTDVASKAAGASKAAVSSKAAVASIVDERVAYFDQIKKDHAGAIEAAELLAAQLTIKPEGVKSLPSLPEKLELVTIVFLGNGNYSTVWTLVKEGNRHIDNWALFLYFNNIFSKNPSLTKQDKLDILNNLFEKIQPYIPNLDLRKIVDLETLMNDPTVILVNVKDNLSLSCVLELADSRMRELREIVLSTEYTSDTDKAKQFSTRLFYYEKEGGKPPIRIIGYGSLPPVVNQSPEEKETYRQKSINSSIELNIPRIFINKTEIKREQWALLNVKNKLLSIHLTRRDLKNRDNFLSYLIRKIKNNEITFDDFLQLYKEVPYQLSSDVKFLIEKREEIESELATKRLRSGAPPTGPVLLPKLDPPFPYDLPKVEPEPQVETPKGDKLEPIFQTISKLDCTDYTDFLDKLWEKTVITYNAQQVALARQKSKNQQDSVMEQKNLKAEQDQENSSVAMDKRFKQLSQKADETIDAIEENLTQK